MKNNTKDKGFKYRPRSAEDAKRRIDELEAYGESAPVYDMGIKQLRRLAQIGLNVQTGAQTRKPLPYHSFVKAVANLLDTYSYDGFWKQAERLYDESRDRFPEIKYVRHRKIGFRRLTKSRLQKWPPSKAALQKLVSRLKSGH